MAVEYMAAQETAVTVSLTICVVLYESHRLISIQPGHYCLLPVPVAFYRSI